MNFRGTPTGIDVRKVIEKNILPFIDTGVAHKEPGVGQIGAGRAQRAGGAVPQKAFERTLARAKLQTQEDAKTTDEQ